MSLNNWWQERPSVIEAALSRARQNNHYDYDERDRRRCDGDSDPHDFGIDPRYVVHADVGRAPATGDGLRMWALEGDARWYIRAGIAPKAGLWWRKNMARARAGGFH
jgi:hypothetical protein